MFYTEGYFARVARRTRTRLCLMIALIAVLCAALGVCCALRLRWLLYAVSGLGFIAVYFIWSMYLTPWLKYNKFMKDMNNGQKRELEVTFEAFTPETRWYDGVLVHDITARVGDREGDERAYVYDADRDAPELSAGQRVRIKSYGHFVVEITPC